MRAFPILGAIIPNSDWGTTFSGVGPKTALEIMEALQELAHPPEGSGTSLTPEQVKRNVVAAPLMTLLFESEIVSAAAVHVTAYRRLLPLCQAHIALSTPPQAVFSPLQIFATALGRDNVDIHESQPDRAAALQTLAQTLMIFARCPVLKVAQHP